MEFFSHASGSSGNLYEVRNDSGRLLLEAGIPIKKIKQALNFRLSEVEACLVSHSHGDHASTAKDVAAAGIDTYMTAETAKAIKLAGHRLKIVEPLKQFRVGTWTILPFPAPHDCPGSVGFLIDDGRDKLLFAIDTYDVRYRFDDLTHIAVECNYSMETMAPDIDTTRKKRLLKSHFSLANVIKLLRATDLSKVREIHLLHLSRENSDPEYFKNEVEKATGKPVYCAKSRI